MYRFKNIEMKIAHQWFTPGPCHSRYIEISPFVSCPFSRGRGAAWPIPIPVVSGGVTHCFIYDYTLFANLVIGLMICKNGCRALEVFYKGTQLNFNHDD